MEKGSEKIMNDKTREFYEKFQGKKITHKDWKENEWLIINKMQPIELIRQGIFQAEGTRGKANFHVGNHWIIHAESIPCPPCGRRFD